MVGITGTNGKTTTAYLIESIFQQAGFPVGVIGTINYRFGGKHFPGTVTTPESADLMRILWEMVHAGVTHVVLEVSSHAIDLERVAACEFDVGIFTNLSQDHLDYHGDMATYWQCKKRFFVDHLSTGTKSSRTVAVLNADDRHGRELAREISVKTLRTGSGSDCDIRSEDVKVDITGTTATIRTPQASFKLKSPLVGKHNVHNVLSATGAGIVAGVPASRIREGLGRLANVPGRLESVPNQRGLAILVDYAHTPEALENVLSALKNLTTGRLITVFGCGGDRDKMKRPIMGKIAARLSDRCVITTDNPRTESPLGILGDIEAGAAATEEMVKYEAGELLLSRNGKAYAIEPDRKRAIELGVRMTRPGDCLLIAGKGHETYQIVGTETLPFDDRVEVRQALERVSQAQGGQESIREG
jgi:UDP-N-acetylmuramyl-tripeptide synthetase